MASHEEINLEDMKSYPFASYGSGVSISVDFSEEAILPNDAVLDRRYLVYDRGTMINIPTHTASGMLPICGLMWFFRKPWLVLNVDGRSFTLA